MERTPGQIAEYGTAEFNANKSVYSVLERGTYINPHGLKYPCEFYHRTEGYKPAGSCAIWGLECWGYRIFWNDGTTGGKFFHNQADAMAAWNSLNKG